MINVYNSNRSWHFQGSNEKKSNPFFLSYLTQSELNLFQKYLQPILDANYPTQKFILERAYINCYPPSIDTDWHTDGENGITILYYPFNNNNFENSGTEFEYHGVEKYIENSIIIFPAELKHRAQGHTVPNAYRFSIAFKLRRT